MTRKITTEIIIQQFIEKHGNRYGYDKVIYVSQKDDVIICCFVEDDKYGFHGDFHQSPDNHKRGKNCPKCTGHYKINQQEFIDISKKKHNNFYNYTSVVFVNTSTDVIIICPLHGNFPQRPSLHLNGSGCKKCATIITTDKQRKSKEQFMTEVFEMFGNDIDCSNSNYINRSTELIVCCTIHNLSFPKIPSVLLGGSGCPECSGKYYKLTTEIFIKKAIEIHGELYDYTKCVYVKSSEDVIIYCRKHKIDFLQTPNSHLSGSGCPNCAIERTNNSKLSYTEEFINRSSIIHNNKYGYELVDYFGSQNKVTIICLFHGNFQQTPSNHLRGQGCPDCRLENIGKWNLSNTDEFIEKSKILFGDIYDYSLTNYTKQNEYVILICKKHNYNFEQKPKWHFRKHNGCKICKKCGYSQKAIHYLNFISSYRNINIKHAENEGEYKIPNTRLSVDGFCQETNTVYEFHGDFWHGNPNKFNSTDINPISNKTFGELYERTIERENDIKQLGYNLNIMWESKWKLCLNSVKKLQRLFRKSK